MSTDDIPANMKWITDERTGKQMLVHKYYPGINPALMDPCGKTADNAKILTRCRHFYVVLAFLLILIVILVIVWVATTGKITPYVTAIVVTVFAGVLIVALFVHWYYTLRGVIPDIGGCWGGVSIGSLSMAASSSFTLGAKAQSTVKSSPAPASSAAQPVEQDEGNAAAPSSTEGSAEGSPEGSTTEKGGAIILNGKKYYPEPKVIRRPF